MTGGTHVDTSLCNKIRVRRARGVPYQRLADEFGVSTATIRRHALAECSHPGEPVREKTQPDPYELVAILQDAADPVLTTGELRARMETPYSNTTLIVEHLKRLADDYPIKWKQPGRDYLWWYDD